MADCKTCSKCGVVKAPDYFWKNRAAKDGLQSRCKECLGPVLRVNSKNWHAANPERAAQTNRDWRSNNRERHDLAKREWAEKNGEKIRQQAAKRQTRYVGEVVDWYVRACLAPHSPGLRAKLPDDLIELKREQLSLLRLTKQLKQEITNQLEKTI